MIKINFEVAPQQHFEPTSAPVQLFRVFQHGTDCTESYVHVVCCCVHVKLMKRAHMVRFPEERRCSDVALPQSLWARRGSWGQLREKHCAVIPSLHITANYKNMHSKEVMSDFYSVLMSRVSPSGLPHAHYWTWRDVSFSAMWNQTPSWLIRMRPCQHTMTSPQCPVLQLRIRLTAEESRWWMSQDTADVVAWGIYCLGRKRIFWEMKWECV